MSCPREEGLGSPCGTRGKGPGGATALWGTGGLRSSPLLEEEEGETGNIRGCISLGAHIDQLTFYLFTKLIDQKNPTSYQDRKKHLKAPSCPLKTTCQPGVHHIVRLPEPQHSFVPALHRSQRRSGHLREVICAGSAAEEILDVSLHDLENHPGIVLKTCKGATTDPRRQRRVCGGFPWRGTGGAPVRLSAGSKPKNRDLFLPPLENLHPTLARLHLARVFLPSGLLLWAYRQSST